MTIRALFEEWYANLPEEDKATEDKKAFARAGFIAGYYEAAVAENKTLRHLAAISESIKALGKYNTYEWAEREAKASMKLSEDE